MPKEEKWILRLPGLVFIVVQPASLCLCLLELGVTLDDFQGAFWLLCSVRTSFPNWFLVYTLQKPWQPGFLQKQQASAHLLVHVCAW